MKRRLLILPFLLYAISLPAQIDDKTLTYDQSIQIVSNLSDVSYQRMEKKSVAQLLERHVGGFRFHLLWDHEGSQLYYKMPNGQLKDFNPVIDEISIYLKENPERILTLFLDLDLPIDTLQKVFVERDLLKYFHKQLPNRDWPTLHEMVQSQKRLVLFTMESIYNKPDWLHNVWNYAVEPYFSLFEAPNFLGEFLKGDPKNDLLIINDFNIPSNRVEKNPVYIIDQNTNHYLLSHCLTIWRNTGKVPNFIFLDQYNDRMNSVVTSLTYFNTIKGRVTFNRELLDYVVWEGRENCQTSGKFVFPIVPGDKITLRPSVPGFSFTPESVFFDEPTTSLVQNFVASPLEISDGLVAYFLLSAAQKTKASIKTMANLPVSPL
ncbi:MAG: hypothetical protein HC819_07970 [Cyclobacteriaceae bacterium]|nr:hypothetical protein [Cyclobacteriaceae bacterium]